MRRDVGRLDREGVASMMRTIFALLFFAVSTLAHAETLTLHSTYDCSGTNPDGSKYTGTATVKVISDANNRNIFCVSVMRSIEANCSDFVA
jgi:hypothetical protein